MTSPTLILNVDDNEGARYANSRALKLAGFAVIEAGTAADAILMIKEHSPSLVLLDVKLPDMSGLEVCKMIKTDPSTASTLVLQTSASLLQTSDKIRALDGGADNFLILPIEPDELVANVRALLRLRDVENAYRNAQALVAEGEERFRQIAENATDVFWIFDFHQQRFLYVNAACAAVWGKSAAELSADPELWFTAIHPEDRDSARAALAGLAMGGESDLQYRMGETEGAMRWIRDRGFAIRDERGEVYRAAGIARDVTEAQQLADSLQASDRRKDEFLATLAHELRNPLAPIRTSITLLQTALGKEQEPVVTRSLAIIDRQSRHLVRLVDDLLDLARITQGKIELQTNALDLQTAVASAMESVAPYVQAREQRIALTMAAEKLVVEGDPVRISQIIANLLHNAAKFSANGKTITLSVARKDQTAEIAVRDEGIGLRPEALADVFGLFVQSQHLPGVTQEGLGIGLSLVKRLTEMHGGTVRAESPGENRGSTFIVTLPLAQAGQAHAGASTQVEQAVSRRILIVDDNADAADSMVAMLELYGHQAIAAYAPRAALEAARSFHPEIALLDIGLPGMSGYELVGLMRGAAAPGATMIALTGYGQESDRERALGAGFDHHLTKPVDVNALVNLFDTLKA